MNDLDTSDGQKYFLAAEDKQKRFESIASEPGGLSYLGRNGVFRGSDGKFYHVVHKNPGFRIVSRDEKDKD
jgi:hypothetical protein